MLGRKGAKSVAPYRSDYRKYPPGQFIRIHLKIEQNRRLFSDMFSSAIMNDMSMTFTEGGGGGKEEIDERIKKGIEEARKPRNGEKKRGRKERRKKGRKKLREE